MAANPEAPEPLITRFRWLLAAIFLVAGTLKALDPIATAQSLARYQLLPATFVAPLAWYLPWIELGCGAALLTRGLRRGGWLLAVLLSAGFAVFTGSALARGLDIDCGCFGARTDALDLTWTFILDLTLLILSTQGLRAEIRFNHKGHKGTVGG